MPVNRRKEKCWEGIDVCVLAGATFPLSRQVSALEQLRSFSPCTDLLQIMLMLSGEQLKWAFTDSWQLCLDMKFIWGLNVILMDNEE